MPASIIHSAGRGRLSAAPKQRSTTKPTIIGRLQATVARYSPAPRTAAAGWSIHSSTGSIASRANRPGTETRAVTHRPCRVTRRTWDRVFRAEGLGGERGDPP